MIYENFKLNKKRMYTIKLQNNMNDLIITWILPFYHTSNYLMRDSTCNHVSYLYILNEQSDTKKTSALSYVSELLFE